MTFDLTKKFTSSTGARISLNVKYAQGRPKGVVQINHGLAEHAARYGRFAAFLSERGFHVYAHDHRGHGATKADDAPQGTFAAQGGAGKVIADVLAVHERIATDHPELPVVLFGHSMGGLVALNFLMRHSERVAAAAIWNANFSAGLLGRLAQALLAWERFRLGSDVPSRLIPKLTFGAWAKSVPDRRTEFDWLSRDPDEVDAYVADPLCGWDPSVSMWRDASDLVFAGASDAALRSIPRDMPINLVGGAKDPATEGGKAVEHLARRMKTAGFSNLVSTIYPETRHESLNELNRDVIMVDFAEWAEKVVR